MQLRGSMATQVVVDDNGVRVDVGACGHQLSLK